MRQLVLVPMPAIEGSYAVHFAKGLVGWDHPDYPALLLASSTLNATESYLWKSIRGSGLAYGAHVEADVESGLTGFSVYRVCLLICVDHVGPADEQCRVPTRCSLTTPRGSCSLTWLMGL